MKYKVTYIARPYTIEVDSENYPEDATLDSVQETEEENAEQVLGEAVAEGDVSIEVVVEEVK